MVSESEARNLWSGRNSNYWGFYYVGVPLLYMAVVVPLGFLVNGIHYGRHTAANGQIQA